MVWRWLIICQPNCSLHQIRRVNQSQATNHNRLEITTNSELSCSKFWLMDVVLSRVVQYCTSDSSLPQVVIIRFSINYHNFPISTLIDWSIDLVTLWLWCCTVINWIISSVSCHPSTRSRSSSSSGKEKWRRTWPVSTWMQFKMRASFGKW